MGITGLLPLLKSIQKPCHLKKFAGQTIGVDAYGWLHRGTVACAVDLAMGKPTRKHIDFSMHRVRMLIHFGIIPYIVFDGDYLPSKAKTEVERAKKREESKQRGLELYRLNKPSQAHLEFQKAIDVTPEMARQLIEELKKIGVQYVVAPYEADAQLVYLERKGIIQGMVSEDSDLLVFGAKSLLTKLDQYGECIEINRADFTACRDISLVGWTDAEFRRMAILSGCDYLANVNKMGLKNAYRLVRRHKTSEKIIRMMQFEGQYCVPFGYQESFNQAELTFLYQRVFCPLEQRMTTLTDPEDGVNPDELSFIGRNLEPDIAISVAKGDLDPMTKSPIYLQRAASGGTTPKTPWGKAITEIGQPLSSKDNKSIEQFFKPKRTPLAELDPNSFTPSPTQRHLLQRASSTSWPSTSTPEASTPSAPPNPGHQRRQIHQNRAVSTPISMSGVPKKRGFNSETFMTRSSEEPQEVGIESKFFNAANAVTAVSGRKSNKIRKKRPTDFTVFSDDSTEEAMIQMAETASQLDAKASADAMAPAEVSKPDQMAPLRTSEPGKMAAPQFSEPDPSTRQASGASECKPSGERETGSEKESHPVPESNLPKWTEQYSFQAGPKPVSPQVDGGASIVQSPSLKTKGSMPRLPKLSALHTLGARALHRSKSSILPRKTVSAMDPNILLAAKKDPSDPLPTLATPSRDAMPRLSLSYSIGPDASMLKGSEDALGVDSSSEHENDSVSEVEETPPKKPTTINLGRFAFTE